MDEGQQKIGRYTIERVLGEGAMGCVYLGHDPELDRKVAIKTVKDEGLSGEAREKFLVRFRNEARAAGRLHHASIVAVYDVGEDPTYGPYLVFEYVPGSTLSKLIQSRGPLEPAFVVRIAEDVGRALDAAHAAGIIHRDIKPDNLLVTEAGRIKLADFGVAHVPNAGLTREGQFLGTPCYAAPETLKSGTYAAESDLFSFAAVLYECIAGVRAFPGDDAVGVAHKVLHDEPPPPSFHGGARVPSGIDAVIMRGLAKEAGDRHRSALDLSRALRGAYDDAGIVTASANTTAGDVVSPIASVRDGEGPRWIFPAVLLGGLLVGIGVTFQLAGGPSGGMPSILLDSASDAGLGDAVDAGATRGADAGDTRDASPSRDASRDGVGASAVDEVEDAGEVGVDAGRAMSAFEREEAAKDALARARALILEGNEAAARIALEEARGYDPRNPDVLQLIQTLDTDSP